MARTILSMSLAAAAAWALVGLTAPAAVAQGPIVTYYPPPPVVGYVPEVRGLFGQRLVYRPVVAAPAARVATYYAPAPMVGYGVPVTTYYAPAAPVVSYPARVTTYYAPAGTGRRLSSAGDDLLCAGSRRGAARDHVVSAVDGSLTVSTLPVLPLPPLPPAEARLRTKAISAAPC